MPDLEGKTTINYMFCLNYHPELSYLHVQKFVIASRTTRMAVTDEVGVETVPGVATEVMYRYWG